MIRRYLEFLDNKSGKKNNILSLKKKQKKSINLFSKHSLKTKLDTFHHAFHSYLKGRKIYLKGNIKGRRVYPGEK